MVYLKEFTLLDNEHEFGITDPRNIHNTTYPFGLFSEKEFTDIKFKDITIFCGTNGTGKSTLINIIAEKLQASRKTPFDKGNNFTHYVNACQYEMSYEEPIDIKCITSDDIFDSLLDIRAINTHVNRKKEVLSQEYLHNKYSTSDYSTYDDIKNHYDAHHRTMSNYVRQRLINNTIIENSNGETALQFWEKEITENSLYLLDEPENSLSPENQLKLKQFIEESVRFYNCQFIISTHSPFLLNLYDAYIYDLDAIPVVNKKWNELDNVKIYYNFFKEHEKEFKNN